MFGLNDEDEDSTEVDFDDLSDELKEACPGEIKEGEPKSGKVVECIFEDEEMNVSKHITLKENSYTGAPLVRINIKEKVIGPLDRKTTYASMKNPVNIQEGSKRIIIKEKETDQMYYVSMKNFSVMRWLGWGA